jgi:CxxC motif-containing protein (DUF1111 family)
MRLAIVIAFLCTAFVVFAQQAQRATEAPAGFDDGHNGLVGDEDFALDKEEFDGAETVADGLGPVYNAQGCRECHQNPISGGASQVTELRVGHRGAGGRFENPRITLPSGEVIAGRSLVNDRAICPEAQMQAPANATIRTFRLSISVLGDGFVEAVADQTLADIAGRQCAMTRGRICGQLINVPVIESTSNETRAGRFGWKNQHASLVSFSADAYLNEMGITSRLQADEVAQTCNPLTGINSPTVPGEIDDVGRFARFMRATKAPPRDTKLAATPAARQGENLFGQIGCAICHVPTLQTVPTGTKLTSELTVPPALGDKIFHPFGDYLLHNVGTGDGIVMIPEEHHGRRVRQRGFRNFSDRDVESTQWKIRTAPLWGVRMRTRLMHDGGSVTLNDAIRRHRGEAAEVTERYERLSDGDREALLTFLRTL